MIIVMDGMKMCPVFSIGRKAKLQVRWSACFPIDWCKVSICDLQIHLTIQYIG
jgi:hypothetical protein